MNARLRPCEEISRRTICSRPSARSNTACTVAVVFSGANEVRTGAAAKEQVDGADEYGLPRSRFARQDVEARFEFDVELVDDRQAADAEKAEHGETGTPIVSDL